jgi:hypothetical protein
MLLYAKSLQKGPFFIWPSSANGVVRISASQLAYMLDGMIDRPAKPASYLPFGTYGIDADASSFGSHANRRWNGVLTHC